MCGRRQQDSEAKTIRKDERGLRGLELNQQPLNQPIERSSGQRDGWMVEWSPSRAVGLVLPAPGPFLLPVFPVVSCLLLTVFLQCVHLFHTFRTHIVRRHRLKETDNGKDPGRKDQVTEGRKDMVTAMKARQFPPHEVHGPLAGGFLSSCLLRCDHVLPSVPSPSF